MTTDPLDLDRLEALLAAARTLDSLPWEERKRREAAVCEFLSDGALIAQARAAERLAEAVEKIANSAARPSDHWQEIARTALAAFRAAQAKEG